MGRASRDFAMAKEVCLLEDTHASPGEGHLEVCAEKARLPGMVTRPVRRGSMGQQCFPTPDPTLSSLPFS